MYNIEDSEKYLDQIVSLKGNDNVPYLQKYHVTNLLRLLTKNHIEKLDRFCLNGTITSLNLMEFVRIMLNIIEHLPIETLYIAIGLSDLFKEICQNSQKDKIEFRQLTDYLCQKLLSQSLNGTGIPVRKVPMLGKAIAQSPRCEYFSNPPSVHGGESKNYKLSSLMKTDKSKHNRTILQSRCSNQLGVVFTLDTLSDCIDVYNQNCVLTSKVESHNPSKLKKDVVILSFTFSHRQLRLGAALKSFNLIFWDHQRNFQYQKVISTATHCANLQTSIAYFEYFDEWLTYDNFGLLKFWDLQQEAPKGQIKCKYQSPITDLCEVPSLGLLVIAQDTRTVQNQQRPREDGGRCSAVAIYDIKSGKIVTEIALENDRVPHTLRFSQQFQVLLTGALQKKIRVFEIHPEFLDPIQKGQLVGHDSLIIHFTLLHDSAMLASADTKNTVKLWNFSECVCIQTVDLSHKTMITHLLDMIQMGKIGIIGSRLNYICFQERADIISETHWQEPAAIEWLDVDDCDDEMYLFTQKELTVLTLSTGRIKFITKHFRAYNEDNVTCFRYFASLKQFLIGNSKGEIFMHNCTTGQLSCRFAKVQDTSVVYIEYDEVNKLIVSASQDATITVLRTTGVVIKQLKNNFQGKQISCFALSIYHNLIAIGSSKTTFYLWSFDNAKLQAQICLPSSKPTTVSFANGCNLLAVLTTDGWLYFLKFSHTLNGTNIQQVLSYNMNCYPISADFSFGWTNQTIKKLTKMLLYVGTREGIVIELDMGNHFKGMSVGQNSKDRQQYNPIRENKENLHSQLKKKKHVIFEIVQGQNEIEHINRFDNTCLKTRANHIAFRCFQLSQTYFAVAVGSRFRICQAGESKILCEYDISYSLATSWDLSMTVSKKQRMRVIFGLKLMQSITNCYKDQMSFQETRKISLNAVLNRFNDQTAKKTMMLTEPSVPSDEMNPTPWVKQPKRLLLQHYSQKDLRQDRLRRKNNFHASGPTLKELDHFKKINMLHQKWRNNSTTEAQEREALLKGIQHRVQKIEDKEHFTQILTSKSTDKLNQGYITNSNNSYVAGFAVKLNSFMRRTNEGQTETRYNFQKRDKKDLSPQTESIEYALASREKSPQFQEYYERRHQLPAQREANRSSNSKFRIILTDMNKKVQSKRLMHSATSLL